MSALDAVSLALLLLGFPLGRTRAKALAPPLSKFLVYAVAPVLGFWAGTHLESEPLLPLALVAEVITFYLARKAFEGCEKKGAAGIVSAFGNTIFLGIPAVLAAGGSVSAAAAYAMLTTFVHYTLAALYSCKGRGKLFKLQPFTVTFLLGVLLGPFSQQLEGLRWTEALAAELSKLGLLILGLSFEFQYLRVDWEVLKVGAFKHLLLPALTLPVALLTEPKSIMLEASMPPAFMNIALAYAYGYDTKLVTKSVITLTLAWLPAFLSLAPLLRAR
ncbi:Auxin Efflux Carrier [Ignicoccus hospitalis KIN4/I]|uniref:Auxin Efflux Carrier n=1 Tax=Ignicoccus hospitalis (strain KIN4/I / DSM 18386 / JCM 14125) TaxID=453591 RepID=A8ABH0_IGNH4|nr:Auxin Efflux Carrier [Ignicoccus hospitalis KIN4/I]